jgi:pilus assembly protein CpaB
MRARTLILLFVAIILAGGTALLARSYLATERIKTIEEAKPLALQAPGKSVLVARNEIKRGQILRPEDSVWQIWPEGGLDKSYIILGGPKTPESYTGWVARNPIASGEPVTESKIIQPGSRGFLAAVLRPGMRAISVPVNITTGISGFIFPGDQVDLLMTYVVPSKEKEVAGEKSKAQQYDHKAVQTVLRDIRIIAIDQALEGKPGLAVPAKTATFEVTEKQSEVIVLANELANSKLTLSLRSLAPADENVAEPSTASPPTREPRSDLAPAGGPSADTPIIMAAAASGASSLPAVTPAAASGGGADRLVQTAQAQPAPAPAAPSGGPRVLSPLGQAPAKDNVGTRATYTVDSEISRLLPQPRSEEEPSEPPKLWVCKGPVISCNIQKGDSDGDKFLQAFQTLRSQGAVFQGSAGR